MIATGTRQGIDDILVGVAEAKIPNLFLLINVAVRRAEQVMEGAPPAIAARAAGPIEVALREIAEERLASDEERKTWAIQTEE